MKTSTTAKEILSRVQVNIPFSMLWDRYADVFLAEGLNPEIGIDAAALDRFSHAEFTDMAIQLRRRGVTITLHGPFFDLSPGSVDPQVIGVTRRRFGQLLDLVPIFRPVTVVCHAGYEWKRYGWVRDQWVENSLATWRWLGGELLALGSRLMLENVYEKRPEDIRIFYEKLGDQRVGFCLDTGHQAAFSRTSLSEWLDCLGPFLGQLHLHDNHGQEDDHIALGRGCIDFPTLLTRLKQAFSKPPVITLEPHEEDDLGPSLDYLARIWPW
jgi:sugar phosphate isomerase/epimerase